MMTQRRRSRYLSRDPEVLRFENMALQFTDADFQAAWKELDEPQLEGGWELFTENMGVKIYRLYDKVKKRSLGQDSCGN